MLSLPVLIQLINIQEAKSDGSTRTIQNTATRQNAEPRLPAAHPHNQIP